MLTVTENAKKLSAQAVSGAPTFEPQETLCIRPSQQHNRCLCRGSISLLPTYHECHLFCLNLKWSALIFHFSSRKKSSGWCTCGLCAETRKSSTRTPPGDCWISPPRARSRSSKTLWCALNTHSQGDHTSPRRLWGWEDGTHTGGRVGAGLCYENTVE